jgi:hypothetical protein
MSISQPTMSGTSTVSAITSSSVSSLTIDPGYTVGVPHVAVSYWNVMSDGISTGYWSTVIGISTTVII